MGKVKQPAPPPPINGGDSSKCVWSYRNPRHYLTPEQWAVIMADACESKDQRITCPGCGRSIFLSIKLFPHDGTGPKVPKKANHKPNWKYVMD